MSKTYLLSTGIHYNNDINELVIYTLKVDGRITLFKVSYLEAVNYVLRNIGDDDLYIEYDIGRAQTGKEFRESLNRIQFKSRTEALNQFTSPVPRVRQPDSDLISYLQYNPDIFTVEDIVNIHAEVPGHNDEDAWYWIIELQNKQFLLTIASCDYTGWDCSSSGHSLTASSADEAAHLAPEHEDLTGREIQSNLMAQLTGLQPFGLEITRH